MAPAAEAEAEASRETLAPGATGFGVAVSFATERGAQLAAAMCRAQLLTRPISLSLGSVTTSCQSPACESPAMAPRTPSALNAPANGAAPGFGSGLPADASSLLVKDWPAGPCPALTSGTVGPEFGALSASERWLMSGWVRLPMVTRTSSTMPGSLTCATHA